MDKQLKNALRQAYSLPSPKGKDEFLKQFREPLTGYKEFMISQIGYIKKRLLIMSFIVFAMALYISLYIDVMAISVLSAFMPFLIIFIITEFSRSISYNMTELEMSCRYSLTDITLVRSFILGGAQFIYIILLIVISCKNSSIGLFMSAVYILVPYLLSLVMSMAFLRKTGGKNIYLSVSLCCFVSVSCILFKYWYPAVFSGIYNGLWAGILIFLSFMTIYEFIKLKRKLVDNEWNLSLID